MLVISKDRYTSGRVKYLNSTSPVTVSTRNVKNRCSSTFSSFYWLLTISRKMKMNEIEYTMHIEYRRIGCDRMSFQM